MCLATMAWEVCWKKVVMENPLNVLSRNLGDFWGNFAKDSGRLKNLSGGLLLLNFVSDYTTERNRI